MKIVKGSNDELIGSLLRLGIRNETSIHLIFVCFSKSGKARMVWFSNPRSLAWEATARPPHQDDPGRKCNLKFLDQNVESTK